MINLKKVWNDNPFDQWTEEELLCMEGQGICYGKGGGGSPPPPPAVQTTTQTSEFPTELRPFISDIFEKGQAVQEQRQREGFQPELTQQLAPFTPDQQVAFEGIREQVGQTRPLFDEATTLARGATRGATDPTEIAALMNPFLRNVVDIEKREAERVADVQEQQLGARAAQAGAFGGSRAAVLEAERQRNLNQQLGDIESRGLATAFQDAQNRLQSQFGREAAGATQLSALGTAIPAQAFKELGALSGVGAAEQQQGQRALDIATQQAREEFGFPQQTLQDFSSILRGFPLPPTTNVSRQTFSPAQPLSTQLLGLGTGLAGLAGAAGAFKKAGGRVGAPVALKNGGYVKLAGGGGLGEMMQGEVQRYQEGGRTQVEILSRLSIEELKGLINNPAKAAELGLSSVLVKRALDDKTARPADLQLSAVKEAARDVGTGDIATLMGEQVTMYDPKSGQMSNRTVPQLTSPLQSLPPEQQLQNQLARNPAIVEAGADDVSIIEKMRASSPYAGAISKDPFKGFTGTIPKPDLGTPTSMAEAQQKFPLKIPPRVDRTSDAQRELDAGMLPMQSLPATPADFGATSTVMGGSYDPVSRGSAQRVTAPPPPAAPELISAELTEATGLPVDAGGGQKLSDFQLAGMVQGKELPDQRRYTAAAGPSIADRFLGTKFGSDVASLFEGESRDEYIKRIAQPSRPMLSIGELGSKIGSYFGDSPEEFEKGQRERELKLAKRKAAIDARKEDPLSAVRDPKNIATAIDEDPGAGVAERMLDPELTEQQRMQQQINEARKAAGVNDTVTETDSITDITATSGRGTGGNEIDLTDLQETTRVTGEGPAAVGKQKAVYDSEVAALKGRDYSDKVEKMLGKAPTYEKGEAPDVSAQMYLALAKVGFEIASAPSIDKDGRPQNLGTIFGKAAKEGIKDVTGILKEKNKIEKELRKERNTQKRADYEDKLKRLNVQENLRKADMDILKTAADIKLKEERNEISRKDAETRRRQEISRSALNSTRASILALERKQAEDGTVLIKDIMSELSKLRQLALKSNLNSMIGVNTKTSTAAYNEQLPLIFEQYRGRVVRNGNPISDAELASILRISPSTGGEGIGGRTINRPDGATVKVN